MASSSISTWAAGFLILAAAVAPNYGGPAIRRHNQKSTKATPVPIIDAPWVVTIEGTNGEDHPILVGSIVSEDTVVTSTFRLENIDPRSLFIRAGTSDRTAGGSIHNISRILTHPAAGQLGFDVGLIRVNPPFELDQTRMPISINSNGVKPGGTALVYGYNAGENLFSDEGSMLDQRTCDDLLELLGGLDTGSMCLIALDICDYDEGASVVIDNTLIGFISQIVICHSYDWPLSYTDFSYPLIAMWLELNI